MITTECPVCGYDPNPQQVKINDATLWANRLKNVFSKNLQNSWWINQPHFVCKWLSSVCGANPKHLLDAGCGDARWLPAIKKFWPNVDYIGIDTMAEHITLNQENFPDIKWQQADVCTFAPDFKKFDTILIMGVFNPKMLEEKQQQFIDHIKEFSPDNIIVLFDLNQTGTIPHVQFAPQYHCKNTLNIPKELEGQHQRNEVWFYAR